MIQTIKIGLHGSGPLFIRIHDDGDGNPWFSSEWPADLRVRTLARGMSYVNRFTGQAGRASVAEHTWRIRELMRRDGYGPLFRRAALLHDVPECLGINDLHSRVKSVLAPHVRRLEEHLMGEVWRRFGRLDGQTIEWPELEPVVKQYDKPLGDLEYVAYLGTEQQKRQILNTAKYQELLPHGLPRWYTPEQAEENWGLAWYEDHPEGTKTW